MSDVRAVAGLEASAAVAVGCLGSSALFPLFPVRFYAALLGLYLTLRLQKEVLFPIIYFNSSS